MKYSLLAILFTLSACSAVGPLYKNDLHNGQVVIYRPSGWTGAATGWDVEINGTLHCNLHYASYFIADVPEGPVKLSSSIWSAPGTSRLSFNASPKEKYYVRLEADGAKAASTVLAGVAGMVAAEGASSTGGPFLFNVVDESNAVMELQGLRLEESCH